MFNKIKSDLMEAMKSQDKFRLGVIRMLKSAIQMETIEAKKDLTDDEVIAVIKREVKKRNSSIEEYTKYNKNDMVDTLKNEIAILNEYLPEELSDDKLNEVIDEEIKNNNATSMKEMGIVIKSIMAKYGSVVNAGKVSSLVKEKLSK